MLDTVSSVESKDMREAVRAAVQRGDPSSEQSSSSVHASAMTKSHGAVVCEVY